MTGAAPLSSLFSFRRIVLPAAVSMLLVGAIAQPVLAQVSPVPDSTRVVTHTVKKGDTLWDIARTYLKNPFRWPEIFQRNTDVVKNPHWIYPGEVIRIPFSELNAAAVAALSGNGAPVVARIRTVSRPSTVFATPVAPAISPVVSGGTLDRRGTRGVRAGEIEAAPYVSREGGPPSAGEILAAVDRPGIATSDREARFQLNDELYISAPGGTSPKIGDRLLAYVLGPEIEDVGQVVVPTAILQVDAIRAGQPIQAHIIRQFGEVKLRQGLLINPAIPASSGTAMPVALGVTGKVVHVHLDPILPSLQHYIEISPALRDGITVGDEFTLIDDKMGRSDPTPAPPVSVGVVQVVRVTPYASTAIIVSQSQPSIREGMTVRLTAKVR
jgi:LysM repeat protein